ncbi:hypothetical protein LCGC14_1704250 [marine sediment metagenome]|uniref:Uncharacterized protein n=1 Tax=marine sediment metagenome TaxID=412755 RepID=A0A0F9HHK9_9ZZZZ
MSEIQRYTIDLNQYTTDNPDGEWMKSVDVAERIKELEEEVSGAATGLAYLTDRNNRRKERIAEFEAEASILLTQYSEYLEKYGYLDSDWWCEPPNAVTRFLEQHLTGYKTDE